MRNKGAEVATAKVPGGASGVPTASGQIAQPTAAPNPFLGRPAGPLQRSRRPRTTESPRASRSLRRSSAGFNEAVVRGRRRVATNPAVTTCNQVASTKPSSEDDGEGSRRTDEKSSAWRPVCESLPPRL